MKLFSIISIFHMERESSFQKVALLCVKFKYI